jgi:hypothetical protein
MKVDWQRDGSRGILQSQGETYLARSTGFVEAPLDFLWADVRSHLDGDDREFTSTTLNAEQDARANAGRRRVLQFDTAGPRGSSLTLGEMHRAIITSVSLVIAVCGCHSQTSRAPRLSAAGLRAALERFQARDRRLSDVASFPENQRETVRATIAAVAREDRVPADYFAVVSHGADGEFEILLTHESCPLPDGNTRGDPCGRCRLAYFDPKSGSLSRLLILQ